MTERLSDHDQETLGLLKLSSTHPLARDRVDRVRAVMVARNNAEARIAGLNQWQADEQFSSQVGPDYYKLRAHAAETRLEAVKEYAMALRHPGNAEYASEHERVTYQIIREDVADQILSLLSLVAPQPEPPAPVQQVVPCEHGFTGPHDYEIHGQRGPVDGWHCHGPVSGGAS